MICGQNVICIFACFSQGGKSGAVQKCSACRGRGVRIMIRQLAPGMVQQMQSVCSDCNGEGMLVLRVFFCFVFWVFLWGRVGRLVMVEIEPSLAHAQRALIYTSIPGLG
jgi:DnaJ family protein A protein 2